MLNVQHSSQTLWQCPFRGTGCALTDMSQTKCRPELAGILETVLALPCAYKAMGADVEDSEHSFVNFRPP